MASPADGLQVIQIKEQFKVALMGFQVVYDRAAWVIPTRLQVGTTAAVLASVFVPFGCLTPWCLLMFGAVKCPVFLCFCTPKITLKMYTYVFVDYGFFAITLSYMLHSNEILTWKSLTGITDDLYLGLAMGTTLAMITFAGMAFTYFLSVKLSD